jgi:hypothetical protein
LGDYTLRLVLTYPQLLEDPAAALQNLPTDHPARLAYSGGLDTIALTHLVREHHEIVEALANAYLAGYRRSLTRWSGFRP